MLTIGDLSKATSLTVKTIRLYHEKGLLPPAVVGANGYRYYDHHSVERARVIVKLRELDVSLAEIKEILETCGDETDVLEFLKRHRAQIESRLRRFEEIRESLDFIIRNETEAQMTLEKSTFEIQEKTAEPMLVAGIRTRGAYADSGRLFGRLCRSVGRHMGGKPFNLYYDREHKEADADFECCVPVNKAIAVDGVSVRQLDGGRCVSLMHRGPYEEIGRSYEKVFAYINQNGKKALVPSREIYLKGPGMIFKGNPRKYLTEIQVLVTDDRRDDG